MILDGFLEFMAVTEKLRYFIAFQRRWSYVYRFVSRYYQELVADPEKLEHFTKVMFETLQVYECHDKRLTEILLDLYFTFVNPDFEFPSLGSETNCLQVEILDLLRSDKEYKPFFSNEVKTLLSINTRDDCFREVVEIHNMCDRQFSDDSTYAMDIVDTLARLICYLRHPHAEPEEYKTILEENWQWAKEKAAKYLELETWCKIIGPENGMDRLFLIANGLDAVIRKLMGEDIRGCRSDLLKLFKTARKPLFTVNEVRNLINDLTDMMNIQSIEYLHNCPDDTRACFSDDDARSLCDIFLDLFPDLNDPQFL